MDGLAEHQLTQVLQEIEHLSENPDYQAPQPFPGPVDLMSKELVEAREKKKTLLPNFSGTYNEDYLKNELQPKIPEEFIPKTEVYPILPYSVDALEPHISKETLLYHWGKHMITYFNNMNSMLEGHPLGVLASNSNAELRQLTAKIDRETDFALFNNCAQVLNHMFFFESIDPEGGGEPTDIEFIHRLNQDFGSVAAFKKKFTAMALDNFGSGWTWLIQRRVEGGARREKFEVVNTDDADTMLTDPSVRACLVCDVWEHAYYIDYRNDRAGYMKAFWNLVNWEHIMAHQWTHLELRDDGEKSSDDGELVGSPDPYDYNHNCLEDSWYDNNGLDKITGKPPKKDNE